MKSFDLSIDEQSSLGFNLKKGIEWAKNRPLLFPFSIWVQQKKLIF
jgi:hypothetical protein